MVTWWKGGVGHAGQGGGTAVQSPRAHCCRAHPGTQRRAADKVSPSCPVLTALPSGVVQPLPLLECTSCPLQDKLSRVKEMMDAWATINLSRFPLECKAINLQKSLGITKRRQRHKCTLSKADR